MTMTIDPFLMTIGLSALFLAIKLKRAQIKEDKRIRQMMLDTRMRAHCTKGSTRGRELYGEAVWRGQF